MGSFSSRVYLVTERGKARVGYGPPVLPLLIPYPFQFHRLECGALGVAPHGGTTPFVCLAAVGR